MNLISMCENIFAKTLRSYMMEELVHIDDDDDYYYWCY